MIPVPEVSNEDVSFGGDAKFFSQFPSYKNIPEEFHKHHGKWQDLANKWFFEGLTKFDVTPKEGVDVVKAKRCVRAIICSFTPSHEYKMALVCYLMSEWFEEVVWA